MEQLRVELSHLLGEKLSRIECVNEKVDTVLRPLHDSQGNPMPLIARSFTTPGMVQQPAWKTSMSTRSGTVRMPVIYGALTHEEHPGPDALLLERLRSVLMEVPVRTPERWEHLKDQVVEGPLLRHRQDSRDCVGMVDNTQENIQPSWYRQRIEVLWTTLNQFNNTGLVMQDKRILFRTRECLPALFEGFNDNCVLIHDNFSLRSMFRDVRSDQLPAMVGPGLMLWAPRECELLRLIDNALTENLLWQYLQRAPVAKPFIWRRWLYVLWDEVAQLVNTGRLNRSNFDLATKSLLPWLAW